MPVRVLSPAVQAAAEVKAEEDKSAQKTKAIQYLASVGCVSCYSGIEKGLLAALDDCTEAVRYEAVKGLRKAAGEPCASCKSGSCCTPNIVKKLEKIARETDAQGCFVEPSARVRRVARLALSNCRGTLPAEPEPTPEEGPSGDTATEPKPEPEPIPETAPKPETEPAEEPAKSTAAAASTNPPQANPLETRPTLNTVRLVSNAETLPPLPPSPDFSR